MQDLFRSLVTLVSLLKLCKLLSAVVRNTLLRAKMFCAD